MIKNKYIYIILIVIVIFARCTNRSSNQQASGTVIVDKIDSLDTNKEQQNTDVLTNTALIGVKYYDILDRHSGGNESDPYLGNSENLCRYFDIPSSKLYCEVANFRIGNEIVKNEKSITMYLLSSKLDCIDWSVERYVVFINHESIVSDTLRIPKGSTIGYFEIEGKEHYDDPTQGFCLGTVGKGNKDNLFSDIHISYQVNKNGKLSNMPLNKKEDCLPLTKSTIETFLY